MPGIADNALVKAAPLIERLAAYLPEPRSGPRWRASSTRCWASCRRPADVLERLAAVDPLAGDTGRAAALAHALADDDRGVGAAERDPGDAAR